MKGSLNVMGVIKPLLKKEHVDRKSAHLAEETKLC